MAVMIINKPSMNSSPRLFWEATKSASRINPLDEMVQAASRNAVKGPNPVTMSPRVRARVRPP